MFAHFMWHVKLVYPIGMYVWYIHLSNVFKSQMLLYHDMLYQMFVSTHGNYQSISITDNSKKVSKIFKL